MICEQEDMTREQKDNVLRRMEDHYLNKTNPSVSAAEKLASARKLFEACMIGMRTRLRLQEVNCAGHMLCDLGLSSASAALASISDLAEAMNDLEREQQSNLGPVQSSKPETKTETGEKNVL